MPSYRVCPECAEQLSPEARRCVCGWKENKGKAAFDPMHGKCSWEDGADRCRFPGSVSNGLSGGGPWFCMFHFLNKDARHGARIVKDSFDWDGKADTYHALRVRHQASRSHMVADGGSQGMEQIPQSIRDLVQKILPRPDREAA